MPRTDEQRLLCRVRQIVYTFVCEDCGKRFTVRYVDDRGESAARASVRHRCRGKKDES